MVVVLLLNLSWRSIFLSSLKIEQGSFQKSYGDLLHWLKDQLQRGILLNQNHCLLLSRSLLSSCVSVQICFHYHEDVQLWVELVWYFAWSSEAILLEEGSREEDECGQYLLSLPMVLPNHTPLALVQTGTHHNRMVSGFLPWKIKSNIWNLSTERSCCATKLIHRWWKGPPPFFVAVAVVV